METAPGHLVGFNVADADPVTDGGDGTAKHEPPGNRLDRFETDADRLPLEVRAIRATDLPVLRRLDSIYRFNQPESYLAPYSHLRSALLASVPGYRHRRPFFVASTGERVIGFAQFQPVLPDQRWLLHAVGASVGVFDAGPVWEALLTHAIRGAGLRGVKRLFARVPAGAVITPALRELGWSAFATETIYAANDAMPGGRVDRRLRRQEPSDTWAIHQLYSAAVPREVQYAEAFTSHRWELPGRAGPRDTVQVRGWLVEEGHHLIGYARTSSRHETHLVEIVHHPERSAVLPELLDGALAGLSRLPAHRVFCAVRGYQAEVETAVLDRDFWPVLEQDVQVRYTTAQARVTALETAPFHVEVMEKLPQRVPTFLHGPRRDRTTT